MDESRELEEDSHEIDQDGLSGGSVRLPNCGDHPILIGTGRSVR